MNAQHGRQRRKSRWEVLPAPYLIVVHFILPHDLDGHLFHARKCIFGSVNIAKGSVTHLLDEDIPIEAGIFGHLRLAMSLLGD